MQGRLWSFLGVVFSGSQVKALGGLLRKHTLQPQVRRGGGSSQQGRRKGAGRRGGQTFSLASQLRFWTSLFFPQANKNHVLKVFVCCVWEGEKDGERESERKKRKETKGEQSLHPIRLFSFSQSFLLILSELLPYDFSFLLIFLLSAHYYHLNNHTNKSKVQLLITTTTYSHCQWDR